jgi:hypothetical protein
MTISPVIIGCLLDIALALTPIEKWKAARSFTSNYVVDKGFVLISTIALIVLIVLFLVVSLRKLKQERKSSDRLFIEYARNMGLSIRECRILLKIAQKAGIRQSESIFTMSSAFDRGTAKVLEEAQADTTAVEENNELRMELAFLREKLGFKQETSSTVPLGQPAKLSSRQIPIDKKIHITRRKETSDEIEATVIKNSDNELAVQLETPVKIIFGEPWYARYYFGSSVWEFDTSVISYDGDVLVLRHSDNVRFINRRRFLRVPVKLSAFIAIFPFEKLSVESSRGDKDEQADRSSAAWGPPKFVPAVVTELAGPGLRIESSLDVKADERILVVFHLEQEQDAISTEDGKKEVATLKIGEAIGDVRHVEPVEDGFSIAVELTGLNDSNIDKLVRATNDALLKAVYSDKNVSNSENAAERVPEHAAASGGQNV